MTWRLWRIMVGGGVAMLVAMTVANLVLYGVLAR